MNRVYLIVLYCITYEKSYDALGLLKILGVLVRKHIYKHTHTIRTLISNISENENYQIIVLGYVVFLLYEHPFLRWNVL